VIDADGYRANVGIVLANGRGQVLWARRVGRNGWQFPQGGIRREETPEEALYRELHEELGLKPQHVEVVGSTHDWLRYDLPRRYMRRNSRPLCVGQKQIWYLLKLVSHESNVCLDTWDKPEFDRWKWVDYWYPPYQVIFFKRDVYWHALCELAPLLFPGLPMPPRPPAKSRTKDAR